MKLYITFLDDSVKEYNGTFTYYTNRVKVVDGENTHILFAHDIKSLSTLSSIVSPPPPPSSPLLITNEFAFWNPTDPNAKISAEWEMDSGSLFSYNGRFWTGIIDTTKPNADSSNGTNSAVFRAVRKQKTYSNPTVSFMFRAKKFVATSAVSNGEQATVFLRYQNQYNLYYATFCRKDGKVVIKKKVEGGPVQSNKGTYYTLPTVQNPNTSYLPYVFPLNEDVEVKASIADDANGNTIVAVFINGQFVISGIDDNKGGLFLGSTKANSPHAATKISSGKVGLRMDNLEAEFWNWKEEGV